MGWIRVRGATFLGVAIAVVVGLVAAELFLRAVGFAPHADPPRHTFRREPPGPFLKPDPKLGYRPCSGRQTVTVDNTYSYTTTHVDRRRITRPLPWYRRDDRQCDIWILGCSFTYGDGLSDHETMPWIVQSKAPAFNVVNLAFNAYGTLHSLLLFREELAKGVRPKVLVLTYASFHDERNTLSRNWLKVHYRINPSVVLPYAEVNDQGELAVKSWSGACRELPLIRFSSVMRLADELYDLIDASISNERETTKAIIREIAEICRRKEICLVIAGLMKTEPTRLMLDWSRELGAHPINIAVPGEKEYYLPFNKHPNAKAARLYAERLTAFLKKTCLEEPSVAACRNRTPKDRRKSAPADSTR